MDSRGIPLGRVVSNRRLAEMTRVAEVDVKCFRRCISFIIGLLGDVAAAVLLVPFGMVPVTGTGTVIADLTERTYERIFPGTSPEDRLFAGLRKPYGRTV